MFLKNNKLTLLFIVAIFSLIIFTEVLCFNFNISNFISYIVVILTTILVNIKLKRTEEIRNIIILDAIFIVGVFISEPQIVSIAQLISYLFYEKKEIKWNLKNLLLTFLIPIVIGEVLQNGYLNLMRKIGLETSITGVTYEVVFFTVVLECMLIFNTIILISYRIIFSENMQFSNKITLIFKVSIIILICIAGLKLFNNFSSLNNANKCLKLMQNTYDNNTIIQNYDTIKAAFYPKASIQDALEEDEDDSKEMLNFNNMPNTIGESCEKYFEEVVGFYLDDDKPKGNIQKVKISPEDIQTYFGTVIDIYESYIDSLHSQTTYIFVIYIIQITYVVSIYIITKKTKNNY